MSHDSLKSLEWLEPWSPVESTLSSKLKAEVLIEQPLLPEELDVVGRRSDCDDVLLLLPSQEAAFAVVHLRWSEIEEHGRRSWPFFYSSLWDWVENCMIPAHAEWKL